EGGGGAGRAGAPRPFRVERGKEGVAHGTEYSGSGPRGTGHGTAGSRWRRLRSKPRAAWPEALADPEGAAGVERAQVGEHRLARDGGLAFRHQRTNALGEIDVETRAEADQAEALARRDGHALAHERDDAPRDQAGDLHHPDAVAARRHDDEAVALVVLARLVEIGIDEGAGVIGDALDAAAHRAAVHM